MRRVFATTLRAFCGLMLLDACGGSPAAPIEDAQATSPDVPPSSLDAAVADTVVSDATVAIDALATADASARADADSSIEPDVSVADGGAFDGGPPLPAPANCPTTGAGALIAPATCFAFSATQAATAMGNVALGAGAESEYAQYALGPAPGTDRHVLLLYFNGTGAHPSEQIASARVNFFQTAASLGYHVLAITYRNETSIGADCAGVDSCFLPSRTTVITGVLQAGSASVLRDIVLTESIDARTALALTYLARADRGGGWSAFLQAAAAGAAPAERIRWTAVATSGHSQGGGHAAVVGMMRPLVRVVQLSSTCDGSDTTLDPATWTRATPAWRTDPTTAYWGLAAHSSVDPAGTITGDSCFHHVANWQNLGMPLDHQNDHDEVCGFPPTDTLHTHEQSVACPDNAPNWTAMLR